MKLYLSALHGCGLHDDNLVQSHAQHCGQDHQVVDGRHGRSVDPLVDRLRSREPEDHLHILYGQAGCVPQPVDVLPGRDSVNEWNIGNIALLCSGIAGPSGVPAMLPDLSL